MHQAPLHAADQPPVWHAVPGMPPLLQHPQPPFHPAQTNTPAAAPNYRSIAILVFSSKLFAGAEANQFRTFGDLHQLRELRPTFPIRRSSAPTSVAWRRRRAPLEGAAHLLRDPTSVVQLSQERG